MNHVERASITDKTVDLLLAKTQRHRGDTLNSGLLLTHGNSNSKNILLINETGTISAHISSPQQDIIGVKLVHWYVHTPNSSHFWKNSFSFFL